jgi:DNA-binding Lrp family transcriptional regulator
MEVLDEIDRTILRLLQTDAKISAKDIANRLNITVSYKAICSYA